MVARLAAAHKACYRISSINAQFDTMHKYQLLKDITHMDFNVIFIKYPSKLSLLKTITGTTRQVYSLFDEHGHLDPDYSTNTGTTSELHNQNIFFEKMT